MRKTLIFTLMALLSVSIYAGKKGREIKPYDGKTQRMGAMVYALPKTQVQIKITAICTVNKPGPFAQYAERYLADEKAIINASKSWTFDCAGVKEVFVPDSSRMYLISGETQQIEFFDGNMLVSSVGSWEKQCPKTRHQKDNKEETVDTLFHTELLGEEALTSTSIPKMAERAAKQIFQLREARMAILSCDVSHQPDGEATKVILERIDREERELTALFIGKKITTRETRCFTVDPSTETHNLIIARMSIIEGIVAADDMIGTPIYVNITPKILTSPTATKKDRKAHKGYFYNVPGSVEIFIRHSDKFSVTRTLDIPQNGYATWLAPSVSNIQFNRNGTIKQTR